MYLHIINIGLKIFDETETCSQKLCITDYILMLCMTKVDYEFNVHGSVHRNNILVYNSNLMHKSQSLFNP